MHFGHHPRAPILDITRIWLITILFATLSACSLSGEETRDNEIIVPEIHGVWVRGRSIASPEKADEVLQRTEAGGFNAVFINVFTDGQTIYKSDLVEQYDKVEAGFDPLAYFVPEAHRRGIAVHAWFVAGRIDDAESKIFLDHPEWMLTGSDGGTIPWLNFIQPQPRQFISDLMLETIKNYGVDGVHFDYTRFPGPEWGFDPYSVQAFKDEYGLDLDEMRYTELPAYGLFEGNPLSTPHSAQVLASFDNGTPAVIFNRYGEGETLILNWKADKRTVAIGSEVMQRGLQYLSAGNKQVYLLKSDTNTDEYGYEGFENTLNWLNHLGWPPAEISEGDIKNLAVESVLVMPNIYLFSDEIASDLDSFVNRGGNVIFIDGPTKSIQMKDIQRITGMQSRSTYFKGYFLITANEEHPLIPHSLRNEDAEIYQEHESLWKEFRRESINTLIRDIYDRIKVEYPEVTVTATITSDQNEAKERYLQDWQAWLKDGYVDFLIPRAYVDRINDIHPVMNDWEPTILQYDPKIIFGVIAYTGPEEEAKPPDQLLNEIKAVLRAGSNGFVIFDLDRTSDEQLSVIKNYFSTISITP